MISHFLMNSDYLLQTRPHMWDTRPSYSHPRHGFFYKNFEFIPARARSIHRTYSKTCPRSIKTQKTQRIVFKLLRASLLTTLQSLGFSSKKKKFVWEKMKPGVVGIHPVTVGLSRRWNRTELWKCMRLLESLEASSEEIPWYEARFLYDPRLWTQDLP